MPKIFEGDLSVSNSFLKVDLGKIRSNYRKIKDRVGKGVKIASVLKSNAYGLGIYYVAPIIMESGCRDIFVTYVSEARIIKKIAKEKGISDMNIYRQDTLTSNITNGSVGNMYGGAISYNQMKSKNSFSGFTFGSIWYMDSTTAEGNITASNQINRGYPLLTNGSIQFTSEANVQIFINGIATGESASSNNNLSYRLLMPLLVQS